VRAGPRARRQPQRQTRWGFHQLEPATAARIVTDAGIRRGDLVLDVGAGNGALTRPLIAAGARVVAVELHPARLSRLRDAFPDRQVRVVQADAGDLRLPRQPFRVVANPPFAATTALLRRLLAPGSRLVAADLVVPRTTLHRWMSARAPGSNRWRSQYVIGPGRRIASHRFDPPAPTDCVVLTIRRR
jgi:23S rRNA (adenine-N6)-dimethyltransferase